MPHEDLSEAVQRVQQHESERRVERLSAELAKLKGTLASLARFRTIIDQAGEAIFLIEPETGRFVDVNETGLRWLGLPRSRLLSLTVADIDVEFPLEYTETVAEHVTDTRVVDRPWMFGAGVHRRRDGSSFPVEVAVSQRRFVNRTYTLVVARESRPRRDAEQALRESEERYQTLFDLTQDAIYLTTRDGRIADVNQSAIDLFGYPRDEFIGLRARNLYIDSQDIRRFQEAVEEHGFVRDLAVKFQASDGSAMSGLLTATLRHTGDGIIGGYQCLIRMPSTESVEVGSIAQGEADAPSVVEKRDVELPDAARNDAKTRDDGPALERAVRKSEIAGTSAKKSVGADELASESEAVSEPDIDVVVNRLVGSAHGYELRDTSEILSEPRSRTKVHRGERARVEVEMGRRAPWEHKPTPPNPVVETRPTRQWPLLLLGVLFAVFGWSGLVDLSYPYGSGLQEWQLSVRVLTIALLGLTMAGSGRDRAARVVSLGVLLLAAVLATTYANYLLDFPFGLEGVVPDTRTALYGAARKATGFTVVAVLFFSWVSWYLWRIGRKPQTESHQTISPKP
jgi:PAS domain S-box-containing protein